MAGTSPLSRGLPSPTVGATGIEQATNKTNTQAARVAHFPAGESARDERPASVPSTRRKSHKQSGKSNGWPNRQVTRNAAAPPAKPASSRGESGSARALQDIRSGTASTAAMAAPPTRPNSATICTKLLCAFSPRGYTVASSSDSRPRDALLN